MNLFGLTPDQYIILKNLAIDPLKGKGCKVWVFGSRAKNTNQKFSDIDLLYESAVPLELNYLFEIKSNLEESNFPIKVDIVSADELAESYKDDILSTRVQI